MKVINHFFFFFFLDISSEGVFYDGADEESSPVELQSPTETLACASPLRVAPSDNPMTVINRDNHSSVRNYFSFLCVHSIESYYNKLSVISLLIESRAGRKCGRKYRTICFATS